MPSIRALTKRAILRLAPGLVERNLPRYPFLVHPEGLAFLCHCINKTASLNGPIVEIGCAAGLTTIFLNKHMEYSAIEKPYICIDTFRGFCPEHIKYEVEVRCKDGDYLAKAFDWYVPAAFDKKLFDRTMTVNGIKRVRCIQADITQFEFAGVSDISFCFIDVDLNIPVKVALNRVFGRMARGGIIAVHDCLPNEIWDGSYDAYSEFVNSMGLPHQVEAGGFGVIQL